MNARLALACSILIVAALAPAGTPAQGYPARPVRVIVPFPPGGAADIVARAITQGMSRGWGTQVLVDNRAGAGGLIGAELVSKLNADIGKSLFSAEVKQRLAVDAAEPAGGTPAELAVYLKTDYERWGKVVKASGIRAE